MVTGQDSVSWLFDGDVVPAGGFGLESAVGRDPKRWRFDPAFPLDDMRDGCYDAKARLADMDEDGVACQVIFPSAMARFVGARFSLHPDKELGLACMQAYNDYMLEEWRGVAPDRYLPVMLLPLWDAALAAKEVHRTVEKGAKTVSWSEGPHLMGFPVVDDPSWDPLFAAITETGVVMSTHIGSSAQSPYNPAPGIPMAAFTTLVGLGGIIGATELMFSSVLQRWPDVQVAVSEGGIGWVPYILERAAYVFERHPTWTGIRDDAMNPVEIFKRNINVCFIEDRAGIEMREHIGVDKIMWEGDYPHTDSSWPNSRAILGRVLEGCSPEEIAAITHGNAERVYRHTIPAELAARLNSTAA
jgi:predicted TIM-barrel fold metal-dependent hydrolase